MESTWPLIRVPYLILLGSLLCSVSSRASCRDELKRASRPVARARRRGSLHDGPALAAQTEAKR